MATWETTAWCATSRKPALRGASLTTSFSTSRSAGCVLCVGTVTLLSLSSLQAKADTHEFTVEVCTCLSVPCHRVVQSSFMELYNERLYDLLVDREQGDDSLDIRVWMKGMDEIDFH
jgi:hypothetical protein